jgi:hypothetical protein
MRILFFLVAAGGTGCLLILALVDANLEGNSVHFVHVSLNAMI